MALKHAQPFDAIDVRPLGDGLPQAVTTSLIKSQGLQLLRIVLRAGEHLPQHSVRGEITLHCIEGHVTVLTPTRNADLPSGHVLLLPAAEAHAVQALAPSTLLVTLCLAPPQE